MLTNFGKFCRKLRIDNGELLYDMAKRLNVSSAFLSKVENGKAKPPANWKEDIPYVYELTDTQLRELIESIDEARIESVINISSLKPDDKDMMFAFARKLDAMNETDRKKWKKMLNM